MSTESHNQISRGTQGLHQHTELTQQLRLSPMQVRFVRMLEMNGQEAEAAVERELDDNPALTVAEEAVSPLEREAAPAFRSYSSAPAAGSEEGLSVWARQPDDSFSLYDHLLRQLGEREMPEQERRLCEYVVGNLDANGYLQRPVASMANDLLFDTGLEVEPAEMQGALATVQSLDPAGVGASDLRESLLLQLDRLPPSPRSEAARRIIAECFEPFSMKHYHKIVSRLGLTTSEVEDAVELIRSLNPKPGAAIGGGVTQVARAIVPDFQIDVSPEGDINISLLSALPDLAVSAGFESAVKLMAANKEARRSADREFVLTRYNDARDFIEMMERRRTTLLAVMTAIAARQRDYLLTGDELLMHPLALKDIAADTGYDVSTVSRATAAKYAATPYGVLPLRFFFSEGYGSAGSDDGDRFSARAIQAALKAVVESEDARRPMSDEQICEALKQRGYDLSRRTVAKYRDRLGIPVARLRKKIL